MNEKPKTVWNRPWKGRGRLAGWFVILLTVGFFAYVAMRLVADPRRSTGEILLRSLGLTLVAILVVVLATFFIRWLCCWRNLRRFLFGLACLATLIAVFYLVENVRAELAWNRYVREQTAKGEKLDLLQLAPAPVPDDQNFFMAPWWAPLQYRMVDGSVVWADTNWSEAVSLDVYGGRHYSSDLPGVGGYQTGRRVKLSEWQDYYRVTGREDLEMRGSNTNWFPIAERPQLPAQDVLLALSRYDQKRLQLIEACSRPDSRFSIAYEEGFAAPLPHLAKMKGAVIYLSLHSLAAMQTGDMETAMQDIKMALRLIESIRTEPILISHLVRMAMLRFALQPVWEGLADHRWSDAQLAAIDVELKQFDLLADYQLGMRGERAMAFWAVDYAERNRKTGFQAWFDDDWYDSTILPEPITTILYQSLPKGWFVQNKLTLGRVYDEAIIPVTDIEKRLINPSADRRASDQVQRMCALRYRSINNYAASMFLPALSRAAQKFAFAQATTDLARTAIAIERYRLATGELPESLDSLTPHFLDAVPHDVINGQPLKYRRTSDGRFMLYSVGYNETDDGGEVALARNGRSQDTDEGDWVWRYPEK